MSLTITLKPETEEKIGLFFSNGLGLIFNEDFILYYIFIKKPLKTLFSKLKKKPVEHS